MADTNAGGRVYICETPKPTDLTQEQFEALTWVEVGKVGSVGETGTETNIVSYDLLSTEVTQKQKGITNARDTPIEVARDLTDAGQLAMRAAALTKYQYAMKFEDDDAPSAGYTNTITYRRGVITGPTRAGGRNEDFILDVFTLGNNQREIVVAPESGSAPTNTTPPSITGAALTQGAVLTADVGEWTGRPSSYAYQWQADTSGNGSFSNISGATSSTHTIAAGQSGDAIRVQVTATNGAGSSSAANSLPVGLAGA